MVLDQMLIDNGMLLYNVAAGAIVLEMLAIGWLLFKAGKDLVITR